MERYWGIRKEGDKVTKLSKKEVKEALEKGMGEVDWEHVPKRNVRYF